MMDLNKYIGIPFKFKGNSFDGCDCWGLIRLFYKNELKINLDFFLTDFDKKTKVEDLIKVQEKILSKFRQVERGDLLDVGDVLVYENTHKKPHVAVFVGNDMIIESYEGAGSILSDLKDRRKERHIETWRHKK